MVHNTPRVKKIWLKLTVGRNFFFSVLRFLGAPETVLTICCVFNLQHHV